MRSFALALALLVVGSCAHAPDEGEPAAQIVADVIITAMARADHASEDVAWPAFRARVAPPVRWDAGGLLPAGDEPGSGILHKALLDAAGLRFGVVARGSEVRVRHFSIDVDDAIPTEALLSALRARGAEISGEGDDESAMFYSVVLPGREYVQLEARRVCRPFESRADRDCRSVVTLNFELL